MEPEDLLDAPGSDRPGAAGRVVCPQCVAHYPPDTLVCVRCGIHLHTGERLPADAGAEGNAEEEKPSLGEWAAALVPGLFRLRTLAVSVVALALAIGCFGVCLLFLGMGVILTAVAAGAVGVVLYAQAVAWILTGELALLVDALAEFDGVRWNAFLLALAIPFTLILAVMFLGRPAA